MEKRVTSHPRVLLVNGEPFNARSATGLTLLSLFRGWPARCLGSLFVADVEPLGGVCNNYWALTIGDVPIARFIMRGIGKTPPLPPRLADESMIRSESALASADASRCAPHWTERVQAYRFIRQLISKHSLMQLASYRVPGVVLSSIDEFQPEVIYTMLGANSILRLVLDIHQRYRIPIVPHIMDDWPSTLYCSSALAGVLRARMSSDFERVLHRSPVRLVIGQDMADEYARRYGGPFRPFMNAVEPDILAHVQPLPSQREHVQLLYVGGLHLNRWRSLLDIGGALEVLDRKEGLRAELAVHTQTRFAKEAARLRGSHIRVLGALQAGEVARALATADILVHVESFDEASRTYARYSISTKLPECMAAGRPILAYGPGELASIRYVRSSGAGLSVDTPNPEALRAGLRRLVSSPEMRQQLAAGGRATAVEHHDAERQREQFRALLTRVAAEPRSHVGRDLR